MSKLIEDFPFTVLLSSLGLLIGTIIDSTQSIFDKYNFSGLSVNPLGFFTTYFSELLKLIFQGMIVGVIVGMIFGFIGLFIDFSRKDE